jgi:hypothetical protein
VEYWSTELLGCKTEPKQLGQQSSFGYTVILPEVPGGIERDHVTLEDADYLILGLSE